MENVRAVSSETKVDNNALKFGTRGTAEHVGHLGHVGQRLRIVPAKIASLEQHAFT